MKEKQNDLIDFKSMYTAVNKLGIRGYQALHFETCKRIWKELVPKSGQADSLQGESNLFETKQMKTIAGALDYIKKCGKYAYQYNMGNISDDDVNPMLLHIY